MAKKVELKRNSKSLNIRGNQNALAKRLGNSQAKAAPMKVIKKEQNNGNSKLAKNPLFKALDPNRKSAQIPRTGKKEAITPQQASILKKNPLANALNLSNETKSKLRTINQQQQQKQQSRKSRARERQSSSSASITGQTQSQDLVLAYNSTTIEQISFRNSSRPEFLRIKNLAPEVTEDDVEFTVSKIAPVKKILLKRMESERDGVLSSITEVFFQNKDRRLLQIAFDAFDNKLADGRLIKCDIDNKSVILSEAKYSAMIRQL